MKKGLWIYLFVLIVIATAINLAVLSPRVLSPATTQNFSISTLQYAMVSNDVDTINVTTASGSGYYRVRAGDSFSEGKHVTGKYFLDNNQLQAGKWIVEAGDSVSITATSPVLISITLFATAGLYQLVIFLSVALIGLFFLFGLFATGNF